ncbi:outer membrane autotransporter protein [Pseudomonas frederiksbergensis]
MPDQHKFRPQHLALAIALALGCAEFSNAQEQPIPTELSSPVDAKVVPRVESKRDPLAVLQAFTNAASTVRKEINSPESVVKGTDANDLFIMKNGGSFTGRADGGGGKNVLQLDASDGGELGDTKNFTGLFNTQGSWTLNSKSDFKDGVAVLNDGVLTNNGKILGRAIAVGQLFNKGDIKGQVDVEESGTFAGNGTVGDLRVHGLVNVNRMHGAPRVKGDLSLSKTGVLAYEVNPEGGGETIKVDGTARLGGATLKIVAMPGEYPLSSRYTIIEAKEKVEGKFDKVLNDLAFMAPSLRYNTKSVGMTYARNEVPIESLATSDNGREFAKNISEPERIPEAQLSSDILNTVVAQVRPSMTTGTPASDLEPLTNVNTYGTAPQSVIVAGSPDAAPQPTIVTGTPDAAPQPTIVAGTPDAAPQPTIVAGTPDAAPQPTIVTGTPDAAPQPIIGTGTPDATTQPAVAAVTPDAAPQPAIVAVTPDATPQPAIVAGTPDAATQPAVAAVTPDAAPQPTIVADTPDATPQPAIVAGTPDAATQPAVAAVTPDAAPQPTIVAGTPNATPQPAVAAVTPDAATQPAVAADTPGAAPQPATVASTSSTVPQSSTPTNAAITALLATDKETAAYALEQLAGSSNANLAKATLSSVDPVNGSMLSAMRQLGTHNLRERNNAPRLAAGNEDNGRVWLQALGHGGKLDRDIEPMQHSTKGLLLGADWSIDEEWRLGLMGGTSRTRLDSKELDGDLDSWHLGAYALRQNGPMSLRLGASYSNHDGSTARRIAFTGFSDRPKGSYDASTQQAFAEVGYNLGRANVSIEPFASLGYQRYQRDGYTEKGGAASLKVHQQSQSNVNSTVGLRLAKTDILDNGMRLTPRFSAGWKHTYGDTYTSTRQRLVTGGSNYTVYGVELDRNSLLVDAGLDLGVSANHSVGVGLTGEVGSDSRNHGVMGQWRMAF